MEQRESFFECVAKDSHISAEDMRAQLAARIQKGMNDPDPVRRAQWEEIPCAGEIPTPEECLRYVVERLQYEDAEALLRRYLIDG